MADRIKKPIILVILDGLGYTKKINGNAVAQASMPHWQSWWEQFPTTILHASGKAVGLPPGYIGNSEVGHRTIGSGRIIKTILVKFNKAIDVGSIFKNKLLIDNFKLLKEKNASLHLIGLLSDAGVHSHEKHLHALLKLAQIVGLKKVFIHPFLDGRDTPPKSAAIYLKRLDGVCKQLDCGIISSVHGRYYAMDRDNNWDRTAQCYNVLTSPGSNKTLNWSQVLNDSYDKNITDEFITPTHLQPSGNIQKGDGILFFNLRSDRVRQLAASFLDPSFNHFPIQDLTVKNNTLTFFISTTAYHKRFTALGNQTLFEKEVVENTLLDVLSEQNKSIFTIAETEKYAHVTYFFRGEKEEKLANETRILIPSRKARDYVDHPEMSAEQITDTVLQSLETNPAFFYLINYANPDMVGHSGNLEATIKACQILDKQLQQLHNIVVEKMDGTMIVTSDHGNAEQMIDPQTQKPITSHTNNPVPFMILNKQFAGGKILVPPFTHGLSRIAPTILTLLEISVPPEMEQKSLLKG
jgi:2,3-bisphosphoglycerate-independent phosphoglycerate mutase